MKVNQSLIIKYFFILICFLPLSSNALEKEKYYSDRICKEMSGDYMYVLDDDSKPDCVTKTHVFEFDWAENMKIYEAIGQSLYYASQTKLKPGVYLLIKEDNSEKYIRKIREVIKYFDLDIELIIKDVRSEN